MRKVRYVNADRSYVDNRDAGAVVREANKVCPHNHGKRLVGNVFRCMRCNAPMGFLRAPKGKVRP